MQQDTPKLMRGQWLIQTLGAERIGIKRKYNRLLFRIGGKKIMGDEQFAKFSLATRPARNLPAHTALGAPLLCAGFLLGGVERIDTFGKNSGAR